MKTNLDIVTKDFQNLFDFKIVRRIEFGEFVLKYTIEIIHT